MTITISSLRCGLQVALLGNITSNLRAINASVNENNIKLFFYYETSPSEEDEELSEVVVSELYADFINSSIEIERIVLPISNKIPEQEIKVFHRKE